MPMPIIGMTKYGISPGMENVKNQRFTGYSNKPVLIKGDIPKQFPYVPTAAYEATVFETSIAETAAPAAYEATVFETSIAETAAPAAATTGIGLTPIVIVGGLLLLLFMMSKGRF